MLIETAMNCSDIHWTEPVKVRGPQGQVIKIDGPLAALNAMTHNWPGGQSKQYNRARHLCMAALGRRVPACSIRDDFIAACVDAGIFAED